jgi:nucleoside-diphosphate-sugar epimerase
VPSFAARIIEARDKQQAKVMVGNLDVLRDLTDVRDAVIAYRRLIEITAKEPEVDGRVVNVGSGRSVAMGEVFRQLARAAGARVEPVTDSSLLRKGEAPEIRADIDLLESLTGWRPRIELGTTLADVVAATLLATSPGL